MDDAIKLAVAAVIFLMALVLFLFGARYITENFLTPGAKEFCQSQGLEYKYTTIGSPTGGCWKIEGNTIQETGIALVNGKWYIKAEAGATK